MILLYRFLGFILYPLIKGYIMRRRNQGKEDIDRLQERFGYPTITRPDADIVWFHAASVGEMASAVKLATLFVEQQPDLYILFTTGTVTSAKEFTKRIGNTPRIIHQFVPIDLTGAANRFFDYWDPVCGLIIEEEYWPNLLTCARKHKCKLFNVNARISHRSYMLWSIFKYSSLAVFKNFRAIFPQEKSYIELFSNLGNDRTKYLGNLKCDSNPLKFDPEQVELLRQQIGTRKVFGAVSTHSGEEAMILRVYQRLLTIYPDLLLLLVPRHITRREEICTLIQEAKLNYVLRSTQAKIQEDTQIYLADTFGELGNIYHLLDFALIGGSLLPNIGGHNAVEAITADCAVLSGVYVENAQQLYDNLLNSESCLMVNNEEELFETVKELLTNHKVIEALKQNAQQYMQGELGATQRVYEEIAKFL